jgi:hypothetical protein
MQTSPVGIYLSDGIYSAIIAGMVAHLIKQEKAINGDSVMKPITCFGIWLKEAMSSTKQMSIAASQSWMPLGC